MEKDSESQKDEEVQKEDETNQKPTEKLFSEDERKLKIQETKKILCKEYVHIKEKIIFWLYKRYAIIYLVFLIISIGLIVVATIPKIRDCEVISELFTAFGTGIIGSIALAIAINISDNRKKIWEIVAQYNSSIFSIYYPLWQIYSSHDFSYLRKISPQNGKEIVVLQKANRVSLNMGIALQNINSHFEKNYKLLTEETQKDLEVLEDQLTRMKNSLECPVDLDNQIDLLCSIYSYSKTIDSDWLKKQLRVI